MLWSQNNADSAQAQNIPREKNKWYRNDNQTEMNVMIMIFFWPDRQNVSDGVCVLNTMDVD